MRKIDTMMLDFLVIIAIMAIITLGSLCLGVKIASP